MNAPDSTKASVAMVVHLPVCAVGFTDMVRFGWSGGCTPFHFHVRQLGWHSKRACPVLSRFFSLAFFFGLPFRLPVWVRVWWVVGRRFKHEIQYVVLWDFYPGDAFGFY